MNNKQPELTDSPFHSGEQQLQARVGVRDRAEAIGRRVIRDHLPEQHREFYEQLPFVFIGATDEAGQPWATIWLGRPGFMSTPNERQLVINLAAIDGDPLVQSLQVGSRLGLLGIEYGTRRRNRLSAVVSKYSGRTMTLDVLQSFGNCPQYIQTRDFQLLPAIDQLGEQRTTNDFTHLDPHTTRLISAADNFYIATSYESDGAVYDGADVSHRGGEPGFVRILEQNVIEFPDFPGNKHFNTLGNIVMNPRAGLTFIDFSSGDVVYLAGMAEIIDDPTKLADSPGAERFVRFEINNGRRVKEAVPIRWQFGEYSPRFEQMRSQAAATAN